MCANSRFGRACRRPRMSLAGLWLYHGLRGGCAAPEPEAVVGATHLFRCLLWHLRRLGCALHPNLRGGSLRASSPLREGQTASPDGARPGLGRRCRTARRSTGRPTRPPPPRSGARHPSGNGLRASIRFSGSILQRQDIAVLSCGSRKSGVLLPLRGSSSCVTGDSAASDSARSPQRTRRIAVRAVFRALPGQRATQSARDSYGRILAPPPVTTKLPAGRSIEDHVGRSVGHDGAALGRGDGVRGVDHTAAHRSCGGAENRGSEGARPPRQPPSGTHAVWPRGVCWLPAQTGVRQARRRPCPDNHRWPPPLRWRSTPANSSENPFKREPGNGPTKREGVQPPSNWNTRMLWTPSESRHTPATRRRERSMAISRKARGNTTAAFITPSDPKAIHAFCVRPTVGADSIQSSPESSKTTSPNAGKTTGNG